MLFFFSLDSFPAGSLPSKFAWSLVFSSLKLCCRMVGRLVVAVYEVGVLSLVDALIKGDGSAVFLVFLPKICVSSEKSLFCLLMGFQ